MPQVVITEKAIQRVEQCRQFLLNKNPLAALRAAQVIEHYIMLLEADPEIGRPFTLDPLMRELIIPFGESGYVALYQLDIVNDRVVIIAFKHQREAGYY